MPPLATSLIKIAFVMFVSLAAKLYHSQFRSPPPFS